MRSLSRRRLFYYVSGALLAMLFMVPGQANAACDVDFNGEKLEIECDDAEDLFFVIEDGAGDLFVNGTDGPFDLGSGDDLVDIYIDTGDGNDFVSIEFVDLSGSIEVKTGGGDDTVCGIGIDLSVGNDLVVRTGDGEDEVCMGFDLLVGNSVDIETGEDDDVVLALFGLGTTAGNDIKIDGNGGDDELFGVNDLFPGNTLEIKGFELVID